MRALPVAIVAAVAGAAGPVQAAPALDGTAMSWAWAITFAGTLLSIATGPLLFAKVCHRHYGKIARG